MTAPGAQDGSAYEDHWYRSMKALSEHPEAAETTPDATDGTPLPEAAVVEADVLTRAAHLLERLRAMPTPEA
jgi:hypothetical protein